LVPIVRRSRPRLPIVVISRDFNYQVRQMVAQEGVTYQIFKPVDMREVSEVISTARSLLA
jgi:DNA-binding NarL/FixJ family response regulator